MPMIWNMRIGQPQALELGIDNINMAHIFDMLISASTWAKPIILDGEVYYWVARSKICDSLPILKLKEDTVYRHLKKLAKLGVISYKKQGIKDLVKVTKKGKKYLVKESENTMSDLNPNHYVGNKSENNSDLNPTYTNTNSYSNNIKNNKKRDQDFKNLVKRLVGEGVLKSKANFTSKGSKLFEALGKSEEEVVQAYLKHYNAQTDVKFAKRVASFLELWDEVTAERVVNSSFNGIKEKQFEEGEF